MCPELAFGEPVFLHDPLALLQNASVVQLALPPLQLCGKHLRPAGGGGGGGGVETTLITGSRLNKRVWWHSLGGVRPLVCMDALQECYYPQNYIGLTGMQLVADLKRRSRSCVVRTTRHCFYTGSLYIYSQLKTMHTHTTAAVC